jgi:iron only hydrogenase large subunit-like protein/uncharacterized Fe-S cluster-containing protein
MGIVHFQAANCKNCYRCIRTCPVKAIEFRDNQAKIIDDECIVCCNCLKECPQNAKTIESDLYKVNRMLRDGHRVHVSLAPSFAGYTDNPKDFIGHLYDLGFAEVRETAEAAAEISMCYAVEFAAKGRLITSACPVVVEYLEKVFPDWLELLAGWDSPMMAHAKWMKLLEPEAKVVFIGPCYAKRKEVADRPGYVDAVLTFDEVDFLQAGLKRTEHRSLPDQGGNLADPISGPHKEHARLYAVEGGVVETTFLPGTVPPSPRRRAVSGIENIRHLLSSMETLPEGYFLELNACGGGCINGPASGDKLHPLLKQERILSYMEEAGCKHQAPLLMENREMVLRSFMDRSKPIVHYSDDEVRSVLEKLGKRHKEDELNCGACGYSSCRDKAEAVLAGKAELYMCMPYAQARAESFAHVLLEKTPNAVIAVTEQLFVKEVNAAAGLFFQMDAGQLTGLPAAFLLDPEEIVLTRTEQVRKKVYFPELRRTAIVSASYVSEQQLYLVILHDLTEQEKEREKLRTVKQETVEMAQRVIENQMRVAQEIAGLLGETTAETKVTLTKMKKLLLEE